MDLADSWYLIDGLGPVDSPALVIYLERIQYNIEQMVRIAGSPGRLMPHVKTYKMSQIVKMQMDNGIHRFKCATIAEAEMLGLAQAEMALLAYQPSEAKINRLIELVHHYPGTRYATLIDNLTTAEIISGILEKKGDILDVYIDINNGNNRTGIPPDKVGALFRTSRNLKGIRVRGLHIYDGHIRLQDLHERKKACDQAFKPVRELVQALQNELDWDPEIIAGGSPTFAIHAERENVVCSPGTTLFWDAGYAASFPDLPFLPAAAVITRIVSEPGNRLLCLDLGHKAIASENPIENRVRFLNAQGLVPLGHSEEHLVVENTKDAPLKTGDILYGIPYHICPTTALYNEVMVVLGHKIVDHWEVQARTRRINY